MVLTARRAAPGGVGHSAGSCFGGAGPRANTKAMKKPNPPTHKRTEEASCSASELSYLSLPQEVAFKTSSS